MDQVKIGKFIAELRRNEGLTQEALGEKLGVTNKTVSRWENGKYMPDIEMLRLLAVEFQVSIDELLSGEKMTGENFRQESDKNKIAVPNASVFSLEERKAYFKKKWRKEHKMLFVLLFIILFVSASLPFLFGKAYLAGLAPLTALIEYGYQNNKMMKYVESRLYD
ncbi:MAG: helix-turn-helix domain-containing protein [Acutalibacteraceae bacterium]